jgi:hypothetical protein
LIPTHPPTPEEAAMVKGMPPAVASGFIMSRREAALKEDIVSSIEKEMGDDH